MTFEEWLPTFSSDNYITTADIKEVWNAAIEAAIQSLEKGHYYWDDDNYGRSTGFYQPHPVWGNFKTLPEDELRKLLTA